MTKLEDFMEAHPHGTTLMARNTAANHKIWGEDGEYGYKDVDPNICDGDHCPYYEYHHDATPEGAQETPIHILIAAYRDQLCSRTLHNLFTRAKNSDRIFVRVIDQTQPGSDLADDEGCWNRYCSTYNTNCNEFKDHVQIVHVDSSKSKGPTDARSKLSAMVHWDYQHRRADNDGPEGLDFHPVQSNDFCMQIDSHMDFSDEFDTGLIAMFHRAENDNAVLSTYVASMEQNNQDVRVVPNLCMVTFTSSIRNWATKECKYLSKPKLTNGMWGAGLSFHRCHAELAVPVDPYLDGVFDGEEGSRGLRFFTHGYDIYTPDRVLVTHDYEGHQSNPVVHTWRKRGEHIVEKDWKWFSDIEKWRPNVRVFGTQRVNLLLGIGIDEDDIAQANADEIMLIRTSRYGLGNKRTLEQATEFSGINLKEKRMEENKCGNLKWVPYDDNPADEVPSNLMRPYAGEALDDTAQDSFALKVERDGYPNPWRNPSSLRQGGKTDAVNGSGSGNGMRSVPRLDAAAMGNTKAIGQGDDALASSEWLVPILIVASALLVVARCFGKDLFRPSKHERHNN